MGHGTDGYILLMFQITILGVSHMCGNELLGGGLHSSSAFLVTHAIGIKRTSKLNVCLYTYKSLYLYTWVLSCVCKCKRLSVCHKLWETNQSVIRVQHSQTDWLQHRDTLSSTAEKQLTGSVSVSTNSDIKMRVPPVWVLFQYSSGGLMCAWVLFTYTNPARWPVMLSYCMMDGFNIHAPCRAYWFQYFTSHLNVIHPRPTTEATQNIQLFHLFAV